MPDEREPAGPGDEPESRSGDSARENPAEGNSAENHPEQSPAGEDPTPRSKNDLTPGRREDPASGPPPSSGRDDEDPPDGRLSDGILIAGADAGTASLQWSFECDLDGLLAAAGLTPDGGYDDQEEIQAAARDAQDSGGAALADLAGLVAENLPGGPGLAAWLSQRSPGQLPDRDLPGVAAAFRRVASWAQAAELAAVAELAARCAARDDKVGLGADGRPAQVTRDATAQVSLGLTLSPVSAEAWTDLAVTLQWRMPATAAALARGDLDVYRARLIAEGVARLSDEAARTVEDRVLPLAGDLTYGQLRAAVRRAVIAADPEGAEQRREASERQARLSLYPDEDHTATLAGSRLPAVHAAAAMARVSALARALKASGAGGGIDFLRANVFLGLLLGTLPLIPPPAGAPPDADPPPDSESPSDADPPPGGEPPPGNGEPPRDPVPGTHPTPGSRPRGSADPAAGSSRRRRPRPSGSVSPGSPSDDPATSGSPPDSTAQPGTSPDSTAAPGTSPDSTAPPGSPPDSTAPPGTSPDSTAPPGSPPDGPGSDGSAPDRLSPPGSPSGCPGRDGNSRSPAAECEAGGADAARTGSGHSGDPRTPGPDDPEPEADGCAATPDPDATGPPGGGADHWRDELAEPSDADAPEDDGFREPPSTDHRGDDARFRGDPLEDHFASTDPVPPWPVVPVTVPAPPGSTIRATETGRPPPGLLDLSMPWTTLTCASSIPAALGRIGPITARQARRLARLAATDHATQWRIILTDQHGHACGTTRLAKIRLPRGLDQPDRAGLVGRVTITVPVAAIANFPLDDKRGGGILTDILRAAARAETSARQLAQINADAPGGCAHTTASAAYRPPPRIRDYITARDLTCRYPYCGQPAWRGDLDHTRPWHTGGLTCSCNLGPLCRSHHILKQLPGWTLTQPQPGIFQWTTPAGRAYLVGPDAQQG